MVGDGGLESISVERKISLKELSEKIARIVNIKMNDSRSGVKYSYEKKPNFFYILYRKIFYSD